MGIIRSRPFLCRGAKYPKLKGSLPGYSLVNCLPDSIRRGSDQYYLIEFYKGFPDKSPFLSGESLLINWRRAQLRLQITGGKTEEIRKLERGVDTFRGEMKIFTFADRINRVS